MNEISKNASVQMVSVDFTYQCNLRCLHCFNCSGEKEDKRSELSSEELKKLAYDLVKLRPVTICICGGEPLTRLNDVIDFTNIIKKGTNNVTQVNIVSNGIIPSDINIVKTLKKIGIDSVQISVDGYSAETHDWLRNNSGTYDKAMLAIQNLISENMSVGVACCPTKRNLSEYKDLLDKCENIGVKNFRMQPLMVIGRAKQNLENYIPEFTDYFKISKFLNAYNRDPKKRMIAEWGDPLEHLLLSKLDDSLLTYCQISAYGDLFISPYIPLAIGNIRKYPLHEYWLNGLKIIWNKPLCKDLANLCDTCEEMDIFNTHPLIKSLMDRNNLISFDFLDDNDKYNNTLQDLSDNR